MKAMTKNSVVRVRVNDVLKHDVESILANLGLTTSDAVNALFSQIRLNKGLPFDVKIPNAVTEETLRKSQKGEGVVRFKNMDDFIADLDVE